MSTRLFVGIFPDEDTVFGAVLALRKFRGRSWEAIEV